MSLRDKMAAEVESLSAAHTKNREAYRAALAERDAANKRVRETCDVASASANELGAARKALEELDRNSPAKVVAGEGEVKS